MSWTYAYTPYIWLAAASTVFLAILAIYGLRHRTVPGAVPFIVLIAAVIPWIFSNALRLASTDDASAFFWFKLQSALLLPLASAALCFAVEYVGLGKWLTRRTLTCLTILPVVYAALILTNDIHHLVWRRIWFDNYVRVDGGSAYWVAVAYGYLLSLLHLAVLAWLFARAPRHRWIAGGLIISAFSIRAVFALTLSDKNPFAPLDAPIIVINVALFFYALALFRFRMFEVVPIARDTVIERMADGIMVLNAENRIVDLNGAAQKILGMASSRVINQAADDVLHVYPHLLDLFHHSDGRQSEVSFGDTNPSWYQIHISPLIDRRGFQLGRLIWFHDTTAQKRAQAQILDHERTQAVLEEREMLARELHDGIGQAVAAAHLQVKSASELLARGEVALADSCLQHLAEATQETKKLVRDYLRGVKSHVSEGRLLTGLREYLVRYGREYGIETELFAPPQLEERRINPTVEVQLQQIIQEALTNIRRHSGASSARVVFAIEGGEILATVEDNGCGFDAEEVSRSDGFGLRAMRGRAEMIGGRLEIKSIPDKGTRVLIRVPRPKEEP